MANKIENNSKNYKPRINLNHNIYNRIRTQVLQRPFSGVVTNNNYY